MPKKYSRVLITGGAGFIGSHVTDQLLAGKVMEVPDKIVILDDFSRGGRRNMRGFAENPRVEVVEGDIRDRQTVASVMEGTDLVFHMAAIRITRCAAEPRLALEVMADGAYNVFEAAVEAKVKKVVASSSASVYGMAEVFPTLENHHPYANRTLYGATKLFNEGVLRSFNDMYGLDYVALRYFNVYGPRMDTHGKYTEVMIRWMDRVAEGQPPIIFGDGTQTMDFVYVEDVARSNVLAAASDATDVVLNVGFGAETSLKGLADTLCEVMGKKLPVEFGPERSVNPVAKRIAGIEAAEKLIGFKAEVDLKEGLRRLVHWWQTEGRFDQ